MSNTGGWGTVFQSVPASDRVRRVKMPVEEIRADLESALAAHRTVVLKAPTGSGKSTQVPGIVSGIVGEGLIIVVQPRRMAARLLANYVAQLEQTRVGEGVGYSVRFESKRSAKTRILFVTDGVLQRLLLTDPELKGVAAVVFDEFHERRLASDVALGLCRELKRHLRPELGLIVMSATLEIRGFEEFFPNAAHLEALGRSFPVEVEHRAPVATASRGGVKRPAQTWERVVAVLKTELPETEVGDRVLVFLAGRYDIQKAATALRQASWAGGWEIAPLYGGLAPKDQDAAVRPGGNRRIILATNIAETSLTIEGVTLVIDSGESREAVFDPRRGFDSLLVREISQASAEQRAGRAGRTQAGRCVRLWSEANHRKRRAFDLPEVHRVDLAEIVLNLMQRGFSDLGKFPWFEAPEPRMVVQARELLERIGAITKEGRLTDVGREISTLPLHPRLGKMLIAADELGCLAEAIFAAALLQGEGVFLPKKDGREECQTEGDTDDFAAEWLAFETAARAGFNLGVCQKLGVLARGARETAKAIEQLTSVCKKRGMRVGDVIFTRRAEEFAKALLQAWPDRLAVRLSRSTLSSRLEGGRKGQLAADSVAKNADVFIATEMIEIGGRDVTTRLDRCVGVELEWLREYFPDDLSEKAGGSWDAAQRRVVFEKQTRIFDLMLAAEPVKEPDLDLAAGVLARKVSEGELVLKNWTDNVEQWISRLRLLAEAMPEIELPGFDESDRLVVLEQICHGALSYKDIKARDPWRVLGDWLSPPQKAALDSFAPERITLANGTSAKLRYQEDGPPIIALKVQQLYGVEKTPTIANGKVKVMLHICAPNQRPWQMTTDLESFWSSGFAQMKKDLAGRYPKHDWEKP